MGAIPVMCLPRLSQREIEHFCEVTQASTWIVPRRYEKIDYLSMIESIRLSQPSLKHIIIDAPDQPTESFPAGTQSLHDLLKEIGLKECPKDTLRSFRPDPEEVCHFMPTGGTTGLSKLVPRTHNDYLCNVVFRAKAWLRAPDDITLIATPVTHNMAIEVSLNPTLLTGGKVVMITSTRSREILEVIQKERVTTMILVPAQLQQIVDFPELNQFDVSSLKVIAGAGSHVAAELTKKVHEKLGCRFYNVFGMSEGPCTQTCWDDPEQAVAHTVGWPVCPHDEFKVIDEAGHELADDKEGELVVRGPCIFRGYYKAEAANREVFTPDGFFRTGDLAKFDCQRLIEVFGKVMGIYFHNAANAVDNEPVQEQGEAESISRIGTLKQDTRDLAFILQKTDELTEDIYKEVAEKGYSFKTVSIYMVLTDLSSKTRSVTLEQPAKDKETIKKNTKNLFEKFIGESTLEIRRVGVKVSGFSREEPKQKQLSNFFQIG
jgi:non-ribosomal peptide synthetase component E (peptide arylation enzyme)